MKFSTSTLCVVVCLLASLFLDVVGGNGSPRKGQKAKQKSPSNQQKINDGELNDQVEDEQEVVDIWTEWRGDNWVQLNFTSHGRHHQLDLRKTEVNLSQVPFKLLGGNEEMKRSAEESLKQIKLMRDEKRRATVAFEMVDGQPSPLLQGGMFPLGKHQFTFNHNKTSGQVKSSKISMKDYINLGNDKVGINKKKRQRRSSPLPSIIESVRGVIELVWIIDYSTLNAFNQLSTSDLSQLTETETLAHLLVYFAHLTTMMDDYYQTMNNADVSVNVALAGYVVLSNANELSNLVENYVISGNYVDGSSALDRLSTWLNSNEAGGIMPPYDHVMLATSYNLYSADDGDDSLAGIAFLGTICEKDDSISVLEMGDIMVQVALVAAHELGHSLGAPHDGSEISKGCPADNHIMDPSGGDGTLLDFRFVFSCCSQRAFYSTIHQTGQCLLTTTAVKNYHSSYDDHVNTYLPGEIFTADDQCYVSYGTQSCSEWAMGISQCKRLYCLNPDNTLYCTSPARPAADGTSCGSGKWCLQGECVTKGNSRSPSTESCYVGSCYGLEENRCFIGYNQYNPDMVQCYSDSVKCDAVEDCTDGSDEWSCGLILRSCPNSYFICTTGIAKLSWTDERYCIPESFKCDGHSDCFDGSDENEVICYTTTTTSTTSTTITSQVLCPSGSLQCLTWPHLKMSCLNSTYYCDGVEHCYDGSDEAVGFCTTTTERSSCPGGYFSCTSSAAHPIHQSAFIGNYCITFFKLCDGYAHCVDNSDEMDCDKRKDCYICSDTSLCVVSAAECSLHCPHDYECDSFVANNTAVSFLPDLPLFVLTAMIGLV